MTSNPATRSQYLLLLGQGGRLSLSLLTTSLLGKALAPGEFGFLALLWSLFLVAQQILDMGSAAVATRQITQQPGNERPVLSALIAWRRLVAIGLAFVCIGLAATNFVSSDPQKAILVAAAAALFLLHYGAYYVVFQVRQAFGRLLLLGLALQTAFLLSCIATLGAHFAGVAIALFVVGREIVQVAGARLLAVRMLGYRLRAKLLDPGIRPLLRHAWVFGLTVLCYKLSFNAGSFFIWTLQTPEALGSYSAAQRLFAPLVDTTWIFVTPLIAAMSLSAVADKQLFRREMTGYFKLLLGAGATIAVGGLLLAPTILQLLYGARYSDGPWSSVAIFRWLTIGFSCATMTPILVVAELARRHERNLLLISAGGLALNLVVNAWAVPRFGAEGGAIATCCSECAVFLALAILFGVRKEIRLDSSVFVYLLPASALAIVLYLLDGMPYAQLAVAVCLAPLSMLLLWHLPEQKAYRRSNLHRVRLTGAARSGGPA